MSTNASLSDENLPATQIDPVPSEIKTNVPHDRSSHSVIGRDRNIDQARIEPMGGEGGQYGHHASDGGGVIGNDADIDIAELEQLAGLTDVEVDGLGWLAEVLLNSLVEEPNMEKANDSSSKGNDVGKSDKQPIYKPTVDAYDQWAPTYDTDGNFLQILDSIMMRQMLPQLTGLLPAKSMIVDLGCGTGRTTLALLRLLNVRLVGLDNSRGMLDIATSRCNQTLASLPKNGRVATLNFETWDMLDQAKDVPEVAKNADAVVSTLVVEHIPLDDYFKACSRILGKGGLLLLTNMHPEMGAESQAGFTDPASGEKVRPVSYVHTIEKTVEEAKRWNFEVVWGPKEKGVREDDLEKLGGRAKKWVGKNVWFGMILRLKKV